jgi:hypothetical protein
MIHLNIYNTSYGWQKGQKSKCQFDFWPFKVENRPKLHVCRWCATYYWKSLDEHYKFSLNLTLIGCLHKKLWASKMAKVPILKILGFSTWESQERWHLGVGPMANHKKYYNEEGGGFPPNPSIDGSCESVYACGSSMHQKCYNFALTNLLFNLCRSKWIIDLLVICPNPHSGVLAHPSYLEVLQIRECITTSSQSIVFIFGFAFESFK